jgi:exopolysaccharide production protein ExoQ
MNPLFATGICVCGIAGLFYLDRENQVRTSKALWLPVVWLSLIGSRPVSFWIGTSPSNRNVQLDGSPLDAAVYGVLIVAALAVLIRRSNRTLALLASNWPILIYFAYCLISVVWSYHPDVSLKRWIKAIGDLAMALVVVTEPRLPDALRRLYSHVGFLLLPTSVLFIKYYGELGRGYTPDGEPMNTGVTTTKNMLGLIVLAVSLTVVWRVIVLLRNKTEPGRRRHLIAQGVLLAFCIALFAMAHSATSVACFMLGSTVILMGNLRMVRRRPAWLHALSLAAVLVGGLTAFTGGEGGGAVSALGRSNLSGRTEIWAAVIPAVPNKMLGAGFESFWITPACLQMVADNLSGWWHPEFLNESHNGYLEVYLNLGGIGVCLLSLILIGGYRSAIAAFKLNPPIGGLMLAYTIVAVIYNVTEAGFRMLGYMWICLLVAVVASNGVVTGVVGGKTPRVSTRRSRVTGETPTTDNSISEGQLLPLPDADWNPTAAHNLR